MDLSRDPPAFLVLRIQHELGGRLEARVRYDRELARTSFGFRLLIVHRLVFGRTPQFLLNHK